MTSGLEEMKPKSSEKKRFSYDHTKAFRVLIRDLARYEAFKKKVMQEKFAWNIDKMTRKDIEDFEEYLRYEKTLSEKYPKQFESILEEYPVEINVVHTDCPNCNSACEAGSK